MGHFSHEASKADLRGDMTTYSWEHVGKFLGTDPGLSCQPSLNGLMCHPQPPTSGPAELQPRPPPASLEVRRGEREAPYLHLPCPHSLAGSPQRSLQWPSAHFLPQHSESGLSPRARLRTPCSTQVLAS